MPLTTAFSRSASSRMTFGDLPPSSSATFFTVAAATSDTRRPARVEPVNETTPTPAGPAGAGARPRPPARSAPPPPRAGRAGERAHVDARVPGDRLADDGPVAGDDVQH